MNAAKQLGPPSELVDVIIENSLFQLARTRLNASSTPRLLSNINVVSAIAETILIAAAFVCEENGVIRRHTL